MAKITVYYDYHEGHQLPFWMFISFKRGEIQWDKRYLHIPITAPFNRKELNDIPETMASATVQLDDITIPTHRPDFFGIDIQRINKRILQEGCIDLNNIEQLVIQMCDIEEVLKLDAVRYYLP
ncbi:hypothetical protein [Paenibacillus tyrfis]|uniref:hypothetical protein n=1 Tax=Paenibacillus tyrfis TaxID=1501230 RepID=UPI000689DDD5|nr:hypothetical protein [Paenibacillus tyrfis]